MNYIKEWTSLPMPELLTGASYRKDWERISAESPFMSPPPTDDPIGQRTELNCSVFSLRGRVTQSQSTNWNEKYVAS